MKVKKRALVLALVAAFTAFPAFAEVDPELALLALYGFRPSGSPEVYSHGIGTGVLFKSGGLSRRVPLRLAAQFDTVYHPVRDFRFGISTVIRPGATVEVPVELHVTDRLALRSSAYIGYRHYIHKHSFLERSTVTSRPMAVVGLRHSAVIAQETVTGIGGEYAMLFENVLRHSLTLYVQLSSTLTAE